VGEALRHVLCEILARGDLRDPALANARVTVTEVRVSPDLRAATAFVLPFGGGDAQSLAKALNHAASHLRKEVAGAVDLRVAPTLHFEPDRSFDEAQRIHALLRSPKVVHDVARTGEDEPDES
jgi:ribosome-binding factor A